MKRGVSSLIVVVLLVGLAVVLIAGIMYWSRSLTKDTIKSSEEEIEGFKGNLENDIELIDAIEFIDPEGEGRSTNNLYDITLNNDGKEDVKFIIMVKKENGNVVDGGYLEYGMVNGERGTFRLNCNGEADLFQLIPLSLSGKPIDSKVLEFKYTPASNLEA